METKDILKKLRKSRGYTNMKDFCEAADVSINTYQNYESGKRVPTAEILIKLADFYGVTVDYLLGRETNEELSREQMESEIIETFNDLPPKMRKILLETAEKLVEASKESNDE